MAALVLTITAAGRAALRNAAGNGTNAVLVATAGITSTAFAPGNPLPDEIKRIATIAGGATAADTMHVTISDTTDGASYSVRGFGIYLTDGTLFASYGQADVIVQKSAQAAMLLAVDVQFADVNATQIIFGDANFSNPQATTERLGVSELATDDETVAGADSTRTVTPKSLLAALNARLGLGAPTDFVKSLLTIAKVDAFRLALGLKAAATFDTGSGNGLDADLLDGKEGAYYRSYANLTGVPAAFPPAPHTHDAADITTGILPLVRGGTGLGAVTAGSFLTGSAKAGDPLVPRTPAQVLADIGAAAKVHSHAMTDVIGLNDALDGKAAKVHTHVIGDVTNLQSTLDTKAPIASPTFTGLVQNTAGSLSQSANAGLATWRTAVSDSNSDALRTVAWRTSSPTNGWDSVFWRMERLVDSSSQAWLDFGASSNSVGFLMRFGYGSSSFGYVDIGTNWFFQTPTNHVGAAAFYAADNTFTNGAPFRFTGMGANGAMYWHGYNGSGDDLCSIQRQNANSSYVLNWNGLINVTQWFNYSDRRLKFNIKRKAVTRGLALHIAKGYSSWQMKADGSYGEGAIAQWVQKKASHHVNETETKSSEKGARSKKRLTVNNLGMAVEMGADNALHIKELESYIAKLAKRIDTLEALK
ncbi:hypothetical protein [Luteibacter mycovicinus]|uniref:hypothetical protein n=1 Tax=Luteibacter mycovicinus TaxID=1500890 RepID=UPI0006913621|nr:hypothetical protein [Luteibacter sp. 9143a]